MRKNNLDKTYWNNRYNENATPWNIGYASLPIVKYIEQLKNKNLKILIPGAGNGYEAEYLWKKGFKNVYALDFAKQSLDNLKNRVPNFPQNQVIAEDFFHFEGQFDLVIEQTFFCALHPNLRNRYVEKTHQLLKPKGKIVGLLFNFELTDSGPPFGGSENDYREMFKNKFNIKVLEPAINSIKERNGKELFFIFEKKTEWP